MNTIIKYKILSETPSCLTNAVNKYLEQGWELWGYPFGDRAYIHQAMIKQEEADSDESFTEKF